MINARNYLESIKALEGRIHLKIRQIEDLREKLVSVSVPMDKEQVTHTKNVDVMENTVAMIVDMQKEIDQQTCQLLKRKKEALGLLDQISPEKASMLTGYYLEGKSTIELGKTFFISRRHVQRRLKEALEEFQIVLEQYDADCRQMSPNVAECRQMSPNVIGVL